MLRLSFGIIVDHPGYMNYFFITDDFGNMVEPPFWQTYWQLCNERYPE